MSAAILLFLSKHWEKLVIAIIIVGFVWWIRGKDVKIANLEAEIAKRDAHIAQLTTDYDQLTALNEERNEEIQRLGDEMQEQSQRLQDALSKPPRVIYRDRIVEVPSISTEPCEQVFVDLHHYIERVLQ